jgi:hypothetical protein
MKKDKLADLECNLSRLNSNIKNYNKLDVKYKDSVEELSSLKDYVKSVDGYIGDLEGKIDRLIEIPKEQNRRIADISNKVNEMSCLIKPPPIAEFERLEKESAKVRPQIEMFKKNIEESRKRIEEKMGTVLDFEPLPSSPIACPRIKNWDEVCDDKGNLVRKALPAPKPKVKVLSKKNKPKSPNRSKPTPRTPKRSRSKSPNRPRSRSPKRSKSPNRSRSRSPKRSRSPNRKSPNRKSPNRSKSPKRSKSPNRRSKPINPKRSKSPKRKSKSINPKRSKSPNRSRSRKKRNMGAPVCKMVCSK